MPGYAWICLDMATVIQSRKALCSRMPARALGIVPSPQLLHNLVGGAPSSTGIGACVYAYAHVGVNDVDM